jgi:hypothetical protein
VIQSSDEEEQLEEETGVAVGQWATAPPPPVPLQVVMVMSVMSESSERRVEIVEVGVLGGNKEGVDSDSEE